MALATLPLVLCVLMVELAVGGAFLMWYIDRTEAAPSGFLKLTAFVDAGAIAFAGVLLPALPRGDLVSRANLAPNALAGIARAGRRGQPAARERRGVRRARRAHAQHGDGVGRRGGSARGRRIVRDARGRARGVVDCADEHAGVDRAAVRRLGLRARGRGQ